MDEHRRSPRQRTFKGGSITLPIGIVDCVIRNISESGALLELKAPALVPDDFNLVIRPEHTRRQCHVTRRKALRLGVQFE
jgi:hypothetical protein